MNCPKCGMRVLPYLEKCDLCGADIQTREEAVARWEEWDRFSEKDQQEFTDNVEKSRAEERLRKDKKDTFLREYMLVCGVIVFAYTFLCDFIAKGGFLMGVLSAMVGGICGALGCWAMRRVRGNAIRGSLIFVGAYVLSDFLKPGGSYVMGILGILHGPTIGTATSIAAGGPYAGGYTAAGYAMIFLFNATIWFMAGAFIGRDIAGKVGEGQL